MLPWHSDRIYYASLRLHILLLHAWYLFQFSTSPFVALFCGCLRATKNEWIYIPETKGMTHDHPGQFETCLEANEGSARMQIIIWTGAAKKQWTISNIPCTVIFADSLVFWIRGYAEVNPFVCSLCGFIESVVIMWYQVYMNFHYDVQRINYMCKFLRLGMRDRMKFQVSFALQLPHYKKTCIL